MATHNLIEIGEHATKLMLPLLKGSLDLCEVTVDRALWFVHALAYLGVLVSANESRT